MTDYKEIWRFDKRRNMRDKDEKISDGKKVQTISLFEEGMAFIRSAGLSKT